MASGQKQPGSEKRRHRRAATKTPAYLHWEGKDGSMRSARAYCLDASESGVRLQVFGDVPESGASIHVRLEEFGFAEYGAVRYVQQRSIVGVEFRLDWATPEHIERWKKLVKAAEDKPARP
jgi:hypothetical protein